MLKKLKLFLDLAFVFAFGISFGKSLTYFLSSKILISSNSEKNSKSHVKTKLANSNANNQNPPNIKDGNIPPPELMSFLWEKGILGKEKPKQEEKKEPETIPVVLSPLSSSYKLVGTIVSGKKGSNWAFIYHSPSNTTLMKKEGEEIEPGAKIVSIKSDSIEIMRGNKKEILFLFEEDEKKFQSQAQANPASPPPQQENPEGVNIGGISPFYPQMPSPDLKQIGENTYEVKKEFVVSNLSNMANLLVSARAIPYIKDGQIYGFRLLNISPSSFYKIIGLQDGDVLKSINGIQISSPEAILKILSDIQNETFFEIVIERGGKEQKLRYFVR